MHYSNQVIDIVFEGLPLEVELDFQDGEVFLNDIRASATGDCVVGLFSTTGQELIKASASESVRNAENARCAA
jgi:hypothetical protein